MAKNNTECQQRIWILNDYQSIIEDPESYGYPNIAEHMSEVIADIKEDVDSAFNCSIKINYINTIIEKWQPK